MITLLMVLGVLIPYLMVGARYSRNRYAEIMHKNMTQVTSKEKIATAKAGIKSGQQALTELRSTRLSTLLQHHKPSCDKVRYTHIGACDCGAMSRVSSQMQKHQMVLDGVVPEPPVARPMMFWIFYMTGDYLRGGEYKAKGYDPELTRQLEQINGIAPIELEK